MSSFLPANTEELFQVALLKEDENVKNSKLLKPNKKIERDSYISKSSQLDVSLDSFSQQIEHKAPIQEDSVDSSTLLLLDEVCHEVSVPDQYNYIPLSKHVPPSKPAREYPFTLDPFQKIAISCIQRSESVLVSAHTSAGKTVVAEYAIAMALQNKQRVIYTSPIKALSNQKYRELQAIFGDVGLMTGDITLNSTATCLVMTTEILRSMLYRGSEIMREVAWVIFDEIHYMRDVDRGVVWEETLILLPNVVKYVFLSATIPNSLQFARWICNIHSQPCHVVYTSYRPTPLQHYLFPSGADGIYLAVDENRKFREESFRKALSVFGQQQSSGGNEDGNEDNGSKSKRRRRGGTSIEDIYKLVKMILARDHHPAIIFSFSKRECESLAMQISRLDLTNDKEKALTTNIFNNAIDSLSAEDKLLPQIEKILPLLRNGIGVHHSGLLPILKELIEILFQEGLIKVLFATETFSIGLNMPARTVVFTNARKFDGRDFRWLTSGEYIQMSGRAGRRGIDSRGMVILMIEEKMEPSIAKSMIMGQPDRLNSAFHLSYNMILNLMRVEGITADHMLSQSFFQFQSGDNLPELKEQFEVLNDKYESIIIPNEDRIEEYYNLKTQWEQIKSDYRHVVHHHSYAVPFIQPGRLIRVVTSKWDFGWCPVVNLLRKGALQTGDGKVEPNFIIDVLAYCKRGSGGIYSSTFEPPKDSDGEVVITPIGLQQIDGISSIRINLPKDLRSYENRQAVYRVIMEVKKRFNGDVPLLDPIEDMNIKDEKFKVLLERMNKLKSMVESHSFNILQDKDEKYQKYLIKLDLLLKINDLKKRLKEATSIIQMEELKCRKKLLNRLGYCNEDGVIELKGRVACEISTGDELLLTELMFLGLFTELSVEQLVSLLSCFVFEENSDNEMKLRDDLMGPLNLLQEQARKIAKFSKECKLEIVEEEYVKKFRPELMEVVYLWAQGAKFSKIIKMTEIFEGSIIRCIRRLDELLRQMAQAARSIGNEELERKFTEGITRIKRDIVFANSLYL